MTATEKAKQIAARSAIAALAVTNGKEAKIVFLHEPDSVLAEAVGQGFITPLALIGFGSAGLEVQPDANCTPNMEPLLLQARSDFLLGLAALQKFSSVN
jgi:hypothetical protein